MPSIHQPVPRTEKYIVQNITPRNPLSLESNPSEVKSLMQKHNRSQHHLIGINPTHPQSITVHGIRNGKDELIEKAVSIINGPKIDVIQ